MSFIKKLKSLFLPEINCCNHDLIISRHEMDEIYFEIFKNSPIGSVFIKVVSGTKIYIKKEDGWEEDKSTFEN